VVCVNGVHANRDFNSDAEVSKLLEENGCAYISATNTFLVREFQMINAAREAARFLHHACRGMRTCGTQGQPVEDALAHFGARVMLPAMGTESDALAGGLGESLYQAYLAGRVTKPALRRMFLTRLDDGDQTETVLTEMQAFVEP